MKQLVEKLYKYHIVYAFDGGAGTNSFTTSKLTAESYGDWYSKIKENIARDCGRDTKEIIITNFIEVGEVYA